MFVNLRGSTRVGGWGGGSLPFFFVCSSPPAVFQLPFLDRWSCRRFRLFDFTKGGSNPGGNRRTSRTPSRDVCFLWPCMRVLVTYTEPPPPCPPRLDTETHIIFPQHWLVVYVEAMAEATALGLCLSLCNVSYGKALLSLPCGLS